MTCCTQCVLLYSAVFINTNTVVLVLINIKYSRRGHDSKTREIREEEREERKARDAFEYRGLPRMGYE